MRMIKNPWWIGLGLGVLFCIAVNVYSFTRIQYLCLDCPVSYGWPFQIAEIGGFRQAVRILWSGLTADLLICIAAGILLVAVANGLFRKPRKFQK